MHCNWFHRPFVKLFNRALRLLPIRSSVHRSLKRAHLLMLRTTSTLSSTIKSKTRKPLVRMLLRDKPLSQVPVCFRRSELAIQREAIHADVPFASSSGSTSTARIPTHGASRSTSTAASLVRRRCSGAGAGRRKPWIYCLCLCAILPWTSTAFFFSNLRFLDLRLQPPQPMMAGMAGVPPGAFIPSPYMQPMPYPPNMHPPNGQRASSALPRY